MVLDLFMYIPSPVIVLWPHNFLAAKSISEVTSDIMAYTYLHLN